MIFVNTPATLTTTEFSAKPVVSAFALAAPRGDLFVIEQTPLTNIELCIIMLNSGMVNRCGPQRLYRNFAQEACKEGLAVIRVDLAGVGDSQADTDETHFDNHRKEDVDVIVKYARAKWPSAKIVLQGLCAGSRVSFKTAKNNPDIDGVLAWSTEIFTASQNMPQSPQEPEDRVSDYDVSSTMSRLWSFLFSFKFLKLSWWRTQFPDGKGFFEEVKYTLKCVVKSLFKKEDTTPSEFLVAADQYLQDQRKVLFLFGEHDERAHSEFRDRFASVAEGDNREQGYIIIETGTHTFSTMHSQKVLFDKSIKWLQRFILNR
jgi:pimeloyl-ACP methyl ester carboxylesterase